MKRQMLVVGTAVAVLLLCLVESSFAGFAQIGTNLGTQSVGMADGAMKIGFLVGLVLIILALIGFATMKKTNIAAGIPIGMAIAGFALCSLSAFVSSGSETFWGTDESAATQTHLNLDAF